MIDVHHLAQDIVGRNEVGGIASAVRATTEGLARCWDDCTDETPGDQNTPTNPYRLALDPTPDGPKSPRVEFVIDEAVPVEPTAYDTRRFIFTITTEDEELAAMQILVQALDGLDQRAQNRVITYISERMA